ncbi:unnamed protein product [Closterium sp. NIES-54]
MLQRELRSAVQIGPSEEDQLDKEIGGGAEKARAEESSKVLELLSHADMVHYLDVTNGWDEDLCKCCFAPAVSQRARRALGIKNLEDLRRHLRQQPRSIPAATPEQQQHNQAAFESSKGTSVQALRREGHRIYPQAQCVSQPGRAPRLCAEAMLLEWMAEPRVGVLMNLGRVRSRLPDILWPNAAAPAAASSSPAPAAPAAPAAPPAPAAAAAWSGCWRCSSCWGAYRRAVSFSAFLVLVARSPRLVTLWKAHLVSYSSASPEIVAQLGAHRQREGDNFASMVVQVLGVKESAELKEGFGFFVQHVLSGGLENAHAEGRGGAGRETAEEEHEEGRHWEKEAGSKAETDSVDSKCGRNRKELKWREHMKGRVWERYVDGMAWILEHGGGEGREFRCSHCGEGSSSTTTTRSSSSGSSSSGGGDNGSRSSCSNGSGSSSSNSSGTCSEREGKGIPKGIYVSGVGSSDLALAVATVLSQAQHRTVGGRFFAWCNGSSSMVEDAAIHHARGRLTQIGLAIGRGLGTAVAAAPTRGRPASKAAAASARGRPTLGSSSGSTGSSFLVPVNTDPVLGVLTYRVACILQWLRIYGSDFISARSCFKDSPQGKVLPMRHPPRELLSLLVRFGAVPEPLDGSSRLPEWEEWSGGDEAPRARGSKSKGVWVGAEGRPMVRCRGDVEGIVDFASVLFVPPACAHCSRCITIYTSHVPVISFIATYAYRPAAALVQRFASVFPPHTREYRNIFNGLGLRAPYGCVRALQQGVEEVPILFLLTLALHHSKDLLPHSGAHREHSSKAGGGSHGAKDKAGRRRAGNRDSGEGGEGGESGRGEGDRGDVWEEVQSWFDVAMLPAAGPEAGRPACRGSQAREYGTPAHAERVMQASEWSAVPRFYEDMTHVAGPAIAHASMCSKRKGKKGEEAAYLEAWPGGVNLVACLREMLLGEPCYYPASPAAAMASHPAASSTPASRPTHLAAVNNTDAAPSTAAAATTSSAAAAAAAAAAAVRILREKVVSTIERVGTK